MHVQNTLNEVHSRIDQHKPGALTNGLRQAIEKRMEVTFDYQNRLEKIANELQLLKA
jgi:hypothetical protein